MKVDSFESLLCLGQDVMPKKVAEPEFQSELGRQMYESLLLRDGGPRVSAGQEMVGDDDKLVKRTDQIVKIDSTLVYHVPPVYRASARTAVILRSRTHAPRVVKRAVVMRSDDVFASLPSREVIQAIFAPKNETKTEEPETAEVADEMNDDFDMFSDDVEIPVPQKAKEETKSAKPALRHVPRPSAKPSASTVEAVLVAPRAKSTKESSAAALFADMLNESDEERPISRAARPVKPSQDDYGECYPDYDRDTIEQRRRAQELHDRARREQREHVLGIKRERGEAVIDYDELRARRRKRRQTAGDISD
ncbi:MAG: hypothetical protein MHM6MM_003175 [Cercozoa sp. M6MM]